MDSIRKYSVSAASITLHVLPNDDTKLCLTMHNWPLIWSLETMSKCWLAFLLDPFLNWKKNVYLIYFYFFIFYFDTIIFSFNCGIQSQPKSTHQKKKVTFFFFRVGWVSTKRKAKEKEEAQQMDFWSIFLAYPLLSKLHICLTKLKSWKEWEQIIQKNKWAKSMCFFPQQQR